jgi:diguanylate cyclase (GGDEF)-like protein/PAS domain S-box-containing protein
MNPDRPSRPPPLQDPGAAAPPVSARLEPFAPRRGEQGRDRPLDWDQLGTPAAVIAADAQLQRANRAFRMLLLRSVGESDATPLDWLARFTPEARAALFTALADRRSTVAPLAWTRARAEAPRCFAVSLRWRTSGARCVAVFHDVTLLRQAELAAQAQSDQLRQIANTAPVPMAYYDADALRCQYANRAYAQTFRLDETAVAGRSMAEILGPELWRSAQPAVDQLRSTRGPSEFEHEITNAQHETRRYTLRMVPQFDAQGGLRGVYVQLEDVTRQREVERAMAESEQRLSRFLQAAVEGIVLYHAGLVFDANPAFCDLLGWSLHELLSRPLLELVPAESQGEWRHVIDDAPASSPQTTPASDRADCGEVAARAETLLLHRDGTRIPVELIARPGEDGEPLRLLVVRDIRDRHAAQARMHYLAHHDPLTGLPNRLAFMSQLEHLMVAAQASSTQLGLLFIDLDHFQRVNESAGHRAGDIQLKAIARRIGEQVRSTDRVARFGGDEFMVLLPGLRDVQDALQVAHKLIAAIAAPIEIEGRSISVTASIGVAIYPRDGDTPDLLIKHADTAMHAAKSRGRATLAEFEPATAASAYANLVLESQLGHAIERREFELLFQPQVSADDGLLAGVEALIRWRHPERGLLAPDEFILLAEQHRLMLPIGDWVLQEAARCAQRWQHMPSMQSLTIAVNLSAMQFQAPSFVASVERALAAAKRPADWLELELTERMLMDDVPETQARLHRLRRLGVRLSVDDFGTGYSSLAQLKLLPVDKMKIDRSFVRGLPAERDSAAIANAIVQLGRGLGLTVVAEGVETLAQQRFLATLGCDQLQGMGISAPLDAATLEAWAAARSQAMRSPATSAPAARR